MNQNLHLEDAIGSRIGGFTGIYDAIADMAKQLTAYEQNEGHASASEFWEEMPGGKDWIETCEVFAAFVMAYAIKHSELPNMAWALRKSVAK